VDLNYLFYEDKSNNKHIYKYTFVSVPFIITLSSLDLYPHYTLHTHNFTQLKDVCLSVSLYLPSFVSVMFVS